VESSVKSTLDKIDTLKITTADSGKSIITAARQLIKAGAQENKTKQSLNDIDDQQSLESDETIHSN
jgi:DNA recombination protein RmuC